MLLTLNKKPIKKLSKYIRKPSCKSKPVTYRLPIRNDEIFEIDSNYDYHSLSEIDDEKLKKSFF